MSRNLDELDDAMMSALLDWRQRNGRSWKQRLQIAWMSGADGSDRRSSSLRQIRNHLGPTWLDRLRPRDLDAAADARGITAIRPPAKSAGGG
jgi:hypothetical protein